MWFKEFEERNSKKLCFVTYDCTITWKEWWERCCSETCCSTCEKHFLDLGRRVV